MLFANLVPVFAATPADEATALLQAALPKHVTIAHATVKQLAAAVFAALKNNQITKDVAEEIVRVAVRAPAVSPNGQVDPDAIVLIVKAAMESDPTLTADLNRKLMRALRWSADHPNLPPIAEGTASQIAQIIFMPSGGGGNNVPFGLTSATVTNAPDVFLTQSGSSGGNPTTGNVNTPETGTQNP